MAEHEYDDYDLEPDAQAEGGQDAGEGKPKEDAGWIKDLRQQAKRAKQLERENAFLRAGVKTDEGLGELIAKTYDGDPDPEKVREYATRYGYEFGDAGQQGHEDSPEDQQRAQAQARLDQVRGAGTGMEPRGIDDEIAEAMAAGDVRRSINLKARKELERRQQRAGSR